MLRLVRRSARSSTRTPPPWENVLVADEATEQGKGRQLVARMQHAAFACHLEMLDHRFLADAENDAGFVGCLAARCPQHALALAIRELDQRRHGRSDGEAACRSEGDSADQLRNHQHTMWQASFSAHDETAGAA